ncbi:MAG: hypothetical protein WDO56_36055 [Gammaproteobacteria bacterium]
MEAWEVWVRSTSLSRFVLAHELWVWPILEMLHYCGLSLLFGTVGLFDLRVLGFIKRIPAGALHRLIPFGIAGYVLNLLTGLAFLSAHPEQYVYNSAFHWKLAFMSLAAINVVAFYMAAFRELRQLPAQSEAPRRTRVLTGISLVCWVAVLTCGRLLTFYRPPFFH